MGGSRYAKPEAMVDVVWLEGHVHDPAIRIIEVDEDTTAYEKGHIRNATAWNWFTDLHQAVGRDYLDQAELGRLVGRTGVGPETTIVLYGGNNNWFATYAYWLLVYRGLDRVRLLDGGRKKWELESMELTSDVPTFAATDVTISAPVRDELRAFREEVLSAPVQTSFIDVRSPEEYRGEKLAPDHLPQEQAQVPGHIPGAVNIPWVSASNPDGTFLSADQLRALYGSKDILGENAVIAYCRIGERSSHTWFALHELLGYRNVKNYDGSWTEYGSLVGVPVEKG
jgi:thiosulfate/3-mercaptopyruvate sulfurtransferase